MRRSLFPLVLILFLAACQGPVTPAVVPTAESVPQNTAPLAVAPSPTLPATPAPVLTSTATPAPADTAVAAVTVAPPTPTPAASPTWHAAVNTLGSALPGMTSVRLEDTWYVDSDQTFQSILAVPYQTDSGWQFALVGQPRGPARGPWDGKTHTLLWHWQSVNLEPREWKMIARPLDYGTFLGQDAQEQWWLVYFPVRQQPTIVMVPLENPLDFHIRFGWDGAFVRDGSRLIYFTFENRRAVEHWSTDNVPHTGFELSSIAENEVLDPTGDGREKLVLNWGSTRHPLAHIYSIEGDSLQTRSFTFLGEMPAKVQATRRQNGRFTPDGPLAFIAPDSPEKPTQWQVYGWTGERFTQQETLPLLSGAPITTLAAGDAIPTLPEDLYFRQENGWYRLPASGGDPVAVNGEVTPIRRCGSADTIRCLSPGKHFLIHERELTLEGAIPAVRSQMNGISTNIPDIVVNLGSYNAFGWAPDESFALLAESAEGVILDRVDPATARRESVLSIETHGFNRTVGVGDITTSDPVVFPDGSYGFAVQSANDVFYPGAGIYRLSADGELTRLVGIPPHNRQCSDPAIAEDDLLYGTVSWSADRSSFLYAGSDAALGPDTPCRGAVIIFARADGSAAWDLTALLLGADAFLWAGEVTAAQ